MGRTKTQPGLLAIIAALTPVALIGPAGAQTPALVDEPAFQFSGSWLAEQSRTVDPAAVTGAQRVSLDGLQFGGLRLGIQVQKLAPKTDNAPNLRYTVASARREWLRSITSNGPRRMALNGSVSTGSLEGLKFGFTRDRSGDGSLADSRLQYTHNGFEADVRVRDVGQRFARSSLMSNDEWKHLKNLVGWKQTDLAFKWSGGPGLSIATSMTRGRKADSDEVRKRNAIDLNWKPSDATQFRMYSDRNAAGSEGRSRSGTSGLSLAQNFGGLSMRVSQDDVRNIKGKTGRTRQLSLSTRDDARTVLSAQMTDARINGGHSAQQRLSVSTSKKARTFVGLTRIQSQNNGRDTVQHTLDMRAKPTGNMALDASHTLTNGDRGSGNDTRLHLNWKPDKQWQLDGQMRHRTGAPQTTADLRLTGTPDARTRVEARVQRLDNPKNPYSRHDSVEIKRTMAKDVHVRAGYDQIATKAGQAAGIARVAVDAKIPAGHLTAAHRTGGEGVLPEETELSFNGALDGGDLKLDARWKRTDGKPLTQSWKASWKVRKGLTLHGDYVENPPDKKGRLQDITKHSVGLDVAVRNGLSLGFRYAAEERPRFSSRRTDVTLKGQIDRHTHVDLGLTARTVTGAPSEPAYTIKVKREIDEAHRFVLDVERKTRAVHGKDDTQATLELVTDF